MTAFNGAKPSSLTPCCTHLKGVCAHLTRGRGLNIRLKNSHQMPFEEENVEYVH